MPKDLVWEEKYRGFRNAVGDGPEVVRAIELLERFVAHHPFCVKPVPLRRNRILLRVVRNDRLPGWVVPLRIYYTVGRKAVYLWKIELYDPDEILQLEITRGFG